MRNPIFHFEMLITFSRVRFGFVGCTTDPHLQMSSATFSTHHQYIHCTGNCFVLIPTT